MDHSCLRDHVPALTATIPGLASVAETRPDKLPFVDVVDCAPLSFLDSEEYCEAVSAEGSRIGLYRVLTRVQAPGNYALNPERVFDSRTICTLRASKIHRLNGQIEDVLELKQGGWSCFPNCYGNEVLEATWLVESQPHPDFLGHYCMLWPQQRPIPTETSAYRLAAHPDLKLKVLSDSFSTGRSGWRTLSSEGKAIISTFENWSAVAQSLSSHFHRVWREHAELLHSLSERVISEFSDPISATKRFLSGFERGVMRDICTISPMELVDEQAGSAVDLTLLGANLLRIFGIEVILGFTCSEWSVPGLWLTKPFVKANGCWLDLLSGRPGVGARWRNTPVLQVSLSGASESPGTQPIERL